MLRNEENKIILFLDDCLARAAIAYQRWDDDRKNNTIWVESASEAIKVAKEYKGLLKEIWLDHDLGGTEYQHSGSDLCGMEVVRYFENLKHEDKLLFNKTLFIIHSWNIPANKSMTERLNKAGYKAISKPFGM